MMFGKRRFRLPIGIKPRKKLRVAVVGIYGAGKTVFLTSLINHLENHFPHSFRIGKGGQIVGFEPGKLANGEEPFDYKKFRRCIVDAEEWPRKTEDVRHFCCRFERTDTNQRYELRLVDFPGERIADSGVFVAKDFADWSDRVIEHWNSADQEYRGELAEYKALLERAQVTEPEVLGSYRLAACRLVLAYKPLISPAEVAVAIKRAATGSVNRSAEALAEAASAQLETSDSSKFAPLTAAARTRWPELASAFARRFDRYKKEVARLFDKLVQVDGMVVLVDIPTILNAGSGMMNDCFEVLEELFRAIKPGGWLSRWFTRMKRPRKIALVANKADLVVKEDRERLERLLREFCGKFEKGLPRVEFARFIASPIASTWPSSRAAEEIWGWLRGRPLRDEAGAALGNADCEREFRVSRLPENGWPGDWQAGQFCFPSVHPRIDKAYFKPPDHIHLDQIFDFLVR